MDTARRHIAGLYEGLNTGVAGADALAARPRECVDVELIVREDHEILEVFRIGACVVVEPVQRIIDTRGTEQRQRLRRGGRQLQRAVGDCVVHGGEVRRVEHIAQWTVDRRLSVAEKRRFDVDIAGIGEMDGNGLARFADFGRHAVVLNEKPDLPVR
jgi:ABC-type transporter Mla MlaB component